MKTIWGSVRIKWQKREKGERGKMPLFKAKGMPRAKPGQKFLAIKGTGGWHVYKIKKARK